MIDTTRIMHVDPKRIIGAVFFLAVASVLALAAALIAQYGFGLHPCELCLYQRIPYSVILLTGVVGLVWRKGNMLLPIALLALLAEIALAIYHVGVEQHWWLSGGCSSGSTPDSLDALKADIMGAAIVRCDEAAFQFLTISMAGWNIIYASLLLIYAIISLISIIKNVRI